MLEPPGTINYVIRSHSAADPIYTFFNSIPIHGYMVDDQKPCDHPILKKEQPEIFAHFDGLLKKLDGPTLKSPKIKPENFLTLVKENSELYYQRIVSSERLRQLGKFQNHYDFGTGLIYLLDKDYNLRTFIHEFLHAYSVYSLGSNLSDFYRTYGFKFFPDFFEGQTEFLTGLILYKKYRKCFDIFKHPDFYHGKEDPRFVIGYSYHEWTKIWLSISVIFGVSPVIESYFCGCVNDLKEVQQKYKDGKFFYLFQHPRKDDVFIKLEDKNSELVQGIESAEDLDYSLLDSQLGELDF